MTALVVEGVSLEDLYEMEEAKCELKHVDTSCSEDVVGVYTKPCKCFSGLACSGHYRAHSENLGDLWICVTCGTGYSGRKALAGWILT